MTTDHVLAQLRRGMHGLVPCELDVPFEVQCGQLPGPFSGSGEGAGETRQAQVAQHVFGGVESQVRAAVARWGPGRVGAVLGTSTGGIARTEQAFISWHATSELDADYSLGVHSFHDTGRLLRRRGGWAGPTYFVSTACSSSTKVFAAARRLIRAGLCDAVLVGGIDSLSLTTVRGFHSLAAASDGLCRPFCAERDGMNVGEGAALLLLERDTPAPVELLGVGESCDAFHMSAPEPSGKGAELAMRLALKDAGLAADAVAFVNAHGTGTARNDSAEAAALERVFGRETPVLSTKSYTGHMLGAAGATEALFTVAALEQGWLPSNLRLKPQDPDISLRLPTEPLEGSFRFAMSNSLAFGGNNASVVFGRAQ
ncbi:MAG: hypothetical protein KUG77_30260 [Nannocystaceae bacterium]|nr:hypothetical protein [Nannocystaceae bacterium]